MSASFPLRFEHQLAEDALELATSLWPESVVRVGADDARVTRGAGVLARSTGRTRGHRLLALLGALATFDDEDPLFGALDTPDDGDPDGP